MYAAHLGEEYAAPPGLWAWVETHMDVAFSRSHWLVVNALFFAAFTGSLARYARTPRLGWVPTAAGIHLLLHGAMHLAHSIALWQYSPGVASGVLLCAPAGGALVQRSLAVEARSDLLRGVAIGILSFPPLIHAAALASLGVFA